MVDIAKLQELAGSKAENMTEAQSGGGGDFERPAEGLGGARLIAYIEIGKQDKTYQGKTKQVDQVLLGFELIGKLWPSENTETGRKTPFVIWITENKYLNEKANFFKLFQRLNYDGKATHFSQLVGKEYKVTVVHETRGEGTDAKTYVNLRNADGYTIFPPFIDSLDDEGNPVRKRLNIAEAKTPLKIFLWDFADKEQWDSIFIDGMFGEQKDKDGNPIEGTGKSKNWMQLKIMGAKNFQGSPISSVIQGGDALELSTKVEEPARSEPTVTPSQLDEGGDPLLEI